MRYFLIITIFVLTCHSRAEGPGLSRAEHLNHRAEQYHFGLKGQRKDFEKARLFYLQAVREGSAQAANHLARIYCNGEGVEKNLEIADKWYAKSAQLDPSIENLAVNDQLENKSTRNIILKAIKGNADAQYDFAQLLESGEGGLKKDINKARNYYELSAKKNHEKAKERLNTLNQ